LLLPGNSGEVVLITPNPDEILFSVDSLRHTESQLTALHITFQKQSSTLTARDPDGVRLVFASSKPESFLHLPQVHIPWLKKP